MFHAFRFLALLVLFCAAMHSADVTLPTTVNLTTTYGPANTTSSNAAGTVVLSPAVTTVKTGRLVLNNFKVAPGASFKCQLVPYFPAAPTASPSPVTATTTTLYVTPVQWYLGENTVTYTWAKTSGPGTATFVAGTVLPDLRKTWTATFSLSGTYVLTVTATAADGRANTYPVTVTVNATATNVAVTPATATPVRGGLVAFTGTARDQFAVALSTQPAISWTTTGGGTFLPKGDYILEASGADIWGTSDGFRFVHQELTGDGTITAKVESLENTNAWAKAGVMIRDGLADNAINAMANVTAASGGLFQRRTTVGGTSTNVITAGQAAPYWVRLTRVGNTLTGYSSPDGVTWTQLGTDTVTMAATVRVGLGVTSHQSGVRAQARFSNVSITPALATAGALPSGWTQQDVNITTPVGSGTYTPSTGTYTVQAAGADIWGTSDQFRFLHRPLPAGDVTLIARVASLTNTNANAKAGLMIRDGLAANAINAFVDVTPTSGVAFQRRTTAGGSTTSSSVTGMAAPRWLKLTRVGTTFTAYASADAISWHTIGSASVTMGATLYAGLAVTSHNATTLTTAAFDNVQILSGTGASALATMQWPWQTQDVGTVVLAGSAFTTTAPGVFLASQTLGGPYTVTATGAGVPTAGTAQVTITNGTPIISIAAAATPSPVTGATTTLTAYGDDDAGEPSLTYTWTTTGTPPASVAFSANGTNAARTTTATFTKAGTYTLRVTATDVNSAVSAPSDVTVIVNQTATSVAVTPTPISVITSTSQQFSAVLRDQFSTAMTTQPDPLTGWTWSVSGGGTITTTGLFTAGATVGGPFTVTATGGGKTGTGQVTVVAPPSITIAATDATATEPGTDTGVFTLTRSGILTVPVTVTLSTTGTATAGTDYTTLPTTVTIPANATTATVTVTPLNDTTAEANETIIATVAAGTGYTVGSPAAATVTLVDDEQRVSIAATDAIASEPGTDTGRFTLTRTGVTTASLSVAFTVSGTATSGSDYTALVSPVVIAAGSATATITVTPLDDTTGEPSETVIATLAANAAYTVVGSAATVTITDNDTLVTIAATDANATEPGTDTGTFTLTRSGPTAAALTVNVTATGTATSGTDYTALPTTATFAAGATTTTVTVTPLNDTAAEVNETVILTVAAGTGYAVGSPAAATVTIVDDEQTVTIAATDATATEPGTDTGTFTITRIGVSTVALTVNLTTTGTATSGTDYAALPATATIDAGATTATVGVTPLNDTTGEINETIIATLAAGTGYTVGTPNAATVTLVDDDQRVTIAATDATAAEPTTDKGTLTITRTGSTTAALTVYFTVTGTATTGTDYTSIGTSAVINAGATTVAITVTPLDDLVYEGAETVIATLAANAAYTVGTPNAATVTINDNDLPTITIAATDASAAEPANNGVFTLTRSGITTATLTVNVTKGGTTSASDHNSLPATVTFSANQATATVTLTPVNDSELEANETATLTIATGTGYNVGSPNTALITLLDDEQGITITATDAAASETSGDTGTFTITRTSGVPTPALTIVLATPIGSALSGTDYGALPTTVAFASNQTTATVTLTPVDDTESESDETVTLAIAPGTGYVLGSPSSATVTITDNDVPTITFLAATSSVGEAGTQLDIPVVLSRPHTAVVTVVYALTGTASGNGDDYYLPNGTMTFAVGESSKTLSLLVRDDATVEANETAILTLSAPVNGSLGAIAVHTATITDNDAITVQVAATDPVVNEDGTHYGAVTFTRTGSLAAALTANLSLTGSTATLGSDFTDPTDTGTKITFPVGVASVTRAVTANQDVLHEADETIVVTVIDGTGYAVGTPNVATLTIRDDDVVTIAATTPTTAEAAAPTNGVFTISRVGTTGNLTVAVAISGTATPTTDYSRSPTGSTVVIPAGQSSVTMTITPAQESLIEGPETVIATIIPTTPTATYTIGTASSATVTINDDDVPTLTLTPTDNTAAEPGGDNAVFTITRPTATTSPLTVTYQVSGTATAGLDYTALSGTATINANATSTTVTITALGDQITETDETVVLTLMPQTTYNVGVVASATAIVKDCTVFIAATKSTALEPGGTNASGEFIVTRSYAASSDLVIPISWGGSASLTADFTTTPATTMSVTIPTGASSRTVTLIPGADSEVEGTEGAVLGLNQTSTYALGSAFAAISIMDATLSISVDRTQITEGASEKAYITVMRTGYTEQSMTIPFTLTGTAILGQDYVRSSSGGSLTIPAGLSSVTEIITSSVNNTLVQGPKTIIATIGPSSYGIATSSATITFLDDDLPTVTLAVSDADVGETGSNSGVFTLSRTGANANPLIVTLTRSGTATPSSDYTATPAAITGSGTITVTIPGGLNSTSITITPINDGIAETTETVILTAIPQATYQVDANQAIIAITDNDPCVVNIQAASPNATEGGAFGVVTLQRLGDPSTNISVVIATSGTATSGTDYTALASPVVFDSGVTSKDIYIVPIDDALVENSETVAVTISSGAGYAVGTPTSATVTIGDNDRPTVTITAIQPAAAEGTAPIAGVVRVTRIGDTTSALTVPYILSGTASTTPGTDYTLSPTTTGSLTIAAGFTTADLTITPVNNAVSGGDKTAVITLGSGTFNLGTATSVTVTIADDELPTISLATINDTASEAGLSTATITVTRSATSASALTVPYAVSGTARSAVDYATLSGFVIIPANATAASIVLVPKDDKEIEPAESISISLITGSGYNLGEANAYVQLLSDDLPAPVVLYQKAGPNTTHLVGGIPADLGIARVLATTSTAGVTVNPISSFDNFSVEVSTASTLSLTSVSLRFETQSGQVGPLIEYPVQFTSGGIREIGDPDSTPIPVPRVTIAVNQASLTGVQKENVDGVEWNFSNKSSILLDVTITPVVGVVENAYVQSSFGTTYPVSGSGTIAIPIQNDGHYVFSAGGTVGLNSRYASAKSDSPVRVCVDRQGPKFTLFVPKKYWADPNRPEPLLNGTFFNGSPEEGSFGNAVKRRVRGDVFYNLIEFAPAGATGDNAVTVTVSGVSGLRPAQHQNFSGPSALLLGLSMTGETLWPKDQKLELSKFDQFPNGSWGITAAIVDRCGNTGNQWLVGGTTERYYPFSPAQNQTTYYVSSTPIRAHSYDPLSNMPDPYVYQGSASEDSLIRNGLLAYALALPNPTFSSTDGQATLAAPSSVSYIHESVFGNYSSTYSTKYVLDALTKAHKSGSIYSQTVFEEGTFTFRNSGATGGPSDITVHGYPVGSALNLPLPATGGFVRIAPNPTSPPVGPYTSNFTPPSVTAVTDITTL